MDKGTPMRIHFERTGGFAGMTMATTFDLDDLPEDEADHLKSLLDDLDFDDLPDKILSSPSGADRFSYTIAIENKKGRRAVETTDSAAPEKLRGLIDLLNQMSRTRRM